MRDSKRRDARASEAGSLTGSSSATPNPKVLHDAADRLNLALLDAEEAFQELRLGVSAQVLLDRDHDTDWCQVLEFRRAGKDFKLMVVSGIIGDEPESFSSTHITSVARETRLQAVQKLPELHAALLEAFHEEVTRVEKSIGEASAFARSLRTGGGH